MKTHVEKVSMESSHVDLVWVSLIHIFYPMDAMVHDRDRQDVFLLMETCGNFGYSRVTQISVLGSHRPSLCLIPSPASCSQILALRTYQTCLGVGTLKSLRETWSGMTENAPYTSFSYSFGVQFGWGEGKCPFFNMGLSPAVKVTHHCLANLSHPATVSWFT